MQAFNAPEIDYGNRRRMKILENGVGELAKAFLSAVSESYMTT